jgi:hypothetical protein
VRARRSGPLLLSIKVPPLIAPRADHAECSSELSKAFSRISVSPRRSFGPSSGRLSGSRAAGEGRHRVWRAIISPRVRSRGVTVQLALSRANVALRCAKLDALALLARCQRCHGRWLESRRLSQLLKSQGTLGRACDCLMRPGLSGTGTGSLRPRSGSRRATEGAIRALKSIRCPSSAKTSCPIGCGDIAHGHDDRLSYVLPPELRIAAVDSGDGSVTRS